MGLAAELRYGVLRLHCGPIFRALRDRGISMKEIIVITLIIFCPSILAEGLEEEIHSVEQLGSFDYIKASALEFAQTPEWMEYRKKLDLARPYAEASAECRDAFSHKQVKEFWYCAFINRNGTVFEQAVHPGTDFSACFGGHMRKKIFPPHDHVFEQMPLCVMVDVNLPLVEA